MESIRQSLCDVTHIPYVLRKCLCLLSALKYLAERRKCGLADLDVWNRAKFRFAAVGHVVQIRLQTLLNATLSTTMNMMNIMMMMMIKLMMVMMKVLIICCLTLEDGTCRLSRNVSNSQSTLCNIP